MAGAGIGIDLGTTSSCCAVWQNDRAEIIVNDEGNRLTPSYVAFTDTGRLVGDAAKSQVARNPANTVFGVKSLIGRRFSDSAVQVSVKHYLSCDLVPKRGDKPFVQVQYKGETKEFAPEEICAMILFKMKDFAESYLGKEITSAVVAVPASFDMSQRNAIKDAGYIAGLRVSRTVCEPVAAASAYCCLFPAVGIL
jgi:heat shock 70kDa protein 1/2/6/8